MEYKYAERVAAELKRKLENGVEYMPFASQSDEDFMAWTNFFDKYKPKAILELGTGDGAFSRWLNKRVEWFFTVDYKEPENLEPPPGFNKLNIFESQEEIKNVIFDAPEPLVLYCDNGDKPREVELFSPFLGPRDYLATHDYQIEIMRDDVPEEFELIYNYGLTAFFRLKK